MTAQPSAEECLARLREGNARFVAGAQQRVAYGWNPLIADGQSPFAVILGCSDSRAPAELVFDQGLGDLFVIRVAGNIIAPSGVGSVEFAVGQFGTPVVVVMGHTRCGAVGAAVQAIEEGENPRSKNLRSITDRITPHILPLVKIAREKQVPREAVIREAVRANILASTVQLRHGSALLEHKFAAGQVIVVGAEYELESGRVEFLTAGR